MFYSLYAVTVAAAVPPFPCRAPNNFILWWKQIRSMCDRPSVHLQHSIVLPPASLHVEFHPHSDWQADWLTLGHVPTSPEPKEAVICGSPPPVMGDLISDKTSKLQEPLLSHPARCHPTSKTNFPEIASWALLHHIGSECSFMKL